MGTIILIGACVLFTLFLCVFWEGDDYRAYMSGCIIGVFLVIGAWIQSEGRRTTIREYCEGNDTIDSTLVIKNNDTTYTYELKRIKEQ